MTELIGILLVAGALALWLWIIWNAEFGDD